MIELKSNFVWYKLITKIFSTSVEDSILPLRVQIKLCIVQIVNKILSTSVEDSRSGIKKKKKKVLFLSELFIETSKGQILTI